MRTSSVLWLALLLATAACGGDTPLGGSNGSDRPSYEGGASDESAAPDLDEPGDETQADDDDSTSETSAPPDDDPSEGDESPGDSPDEQGEEDGAETPTDPGDGEEDEPDDGPPEGTGDGEGEGDGEEEEPEAPVVLRFVAMGDTGEGNAEQYRVAAGVQARCDRAGGCDGFLMLGDNIYDDGPESSDDSEFDQKIDLPYADLRAGPPPAEGEPDTRPRMPIYVSLGNHDLGGLGLNSSLIAYYIDYASTRDWFYYPAEYWDLRMGIVHLISLHTNPLAYLGTTVDEQGAMVDRVVDTTEATWTIAFGHHPYRSQGAHGNAGEYEGLPLHIAPLGEAFREFTDQTLCNRVDFYICGHDHNRQWMESVPRIPSWPPNMAEGPCNTHFAVSGAGAKTTGLEDRDNQLAFASEELGFLFMELTPDAAFVEFCNADGETDWQRTITR